MIQYTPESSDTSLPYPSYTLQLALGGFSGSLRHRQEVVAGESLLATCMASLCNLQIKKQAIFAFAIDCIFYDSMIYKPLTTSFKGDSTVPLVILTR